MGRVCGVRRAGPQDAAAIRDLTRKVYAKWTPFIGREPKPMTADYDKAVRGHWIDLIEEGGELVALIEMIPAGDHLIVENLAVAESAQGKGFGARLLAHAEQVAREAGFEEVRLYTNAAFAGNVAYYFRRGYRETARTALPDGGATVHFAKAVS
ncbi:MAG: GNAT family N-acetyltransferase [Rhizobiales bacterium]|nr:GNAT family N-acetyltransferase [Hyphomicrobiales bacterium]